MAKKSFIDELDNLNPEDDIDLGADDEDVARLIGDYRNTKEFDDEARKLAFFDDADFYLRALDNY